MSGKRRRTAVPAALPWLAGLAGGAGLMAAAFLPWFAVNIAPPFEASSVSGWDATLFARGAVILGGLIALSSAARALGERGVFALEPQVRTGLAWAVLVAAVIALVLVAFRVVILPDPAHLLSRQIGLYAALAACVIAALGGIGLLADDD